jgi:hypothetical protein
MVASLRTILSKTSPMYLGLSSVMTCSAMDASVQGTMKRQHILRATSRKTIRTGTSPVGTRVEAVPGDASSSEGNAPKDASCVWAASAAAAAEAASVAALSRSRIPSTATAKAKSWRRV